MKSFRPFFTAVLPLIWGATCVVSFSHPGGNYTLWGMGSLPGLWVIILRGNGGDIHGFLLPVAAAGVLTMMVLGLALDALQALRKLFLMLWLSLAGGLIAAALVFGDRLLQRASTPTEGMISLGLAALNLGLWFTTVMVLIASFAVWVIVRWRFRERRESGAEEPTT